jgi:regulator of replication initiation timing
MKAKTILDTEKKDAIDIATELCYSEEVKKKLHRQNLFTKLVASLNKHGSIKSDISERRKRNMNLEEFRKALSSDATEENAQLKRQLSDLQTEYHEKLSKLENENDSLKESCRVLCNRCFTLTRGVTCLFCGLYYPCPHMPRLEEQVAMAHKLRKEIEKNG